jgi:predicted CxxxxCH...CXXCH cytochrome family protein
MRTFLLVAVIAACDGSLTGMGDDAPPPNADPQAGCAMSCHGTEDNNAPPKSVAGTTDTTAKAVGAHQAHMNPAPAWHQAVKCADCHVVPADVTSPGHIDGDNIAEVTFSQRAGASSWTGTTCTTGCHGNAAWGGTKPTPTWTLVDGSQSQCGSCHGAPPPAPHPTEKNCAMCHPTMEDNSLAFRDPESHIDGKVDLADGVTGGCTGTCHGTANVNAAPPKDLAGNMASAKVGAHQAHLKTSTWRHAIACTACHVVPLTQDSPGHRDGDNIAEVKFDTMNPAGTYAAGTCSTNYCHGNGRGNTGTATWASPTALACGSCHSITGTGMSGDHNKHVNGENMRCSQCHGTVVDANRNIINANLHVNGVHEVKMTNGTYNPATRQCSNTGCHGTETW